MVKAKTRTNLSILPKKKRKRFQNCINQTDKCFAFFLQKTKLNYQLV